MKKILVTYLIKHIDSAHNKELVIYGFEILYLNITKLTLILGIAILIGIIKEVIIFLLFYGIIKLSSYGVHAATTKTCLILSFTFTCLPMLIINKVAINNFGLIVLWIIVLIIFWKYAPADTRKKPIESTTFKSKLKKIALITLLFYITLSWLNLFGIRNIIIYSALLQSFLISPISYKILNEPYDNGKELVI